MLAMSKILDNELWDEFVTQRCVWDACWPTKRGTGYVVLYATSRSQLLDVSAVKYKHKKSGDYSVECVWLTYSCINATRTGTACGLFLQKTITRQSHECITCPVRWNLSAENDNNRYRSVLSVVARGNGVVMSVCTPSISVPKIRPTYIKLITVNLLWILPIKFVCGSIRFILRTTLLKGISRLSLRLDLCVLR